MRNLGNFTQIAVQSGGNIQTYIRQCGVIDPSEANAFLQAWNNYLNVQNKPTTSTTTAIFDKSKTIQDLSFSVKSYRLQEGEMKEISTIVDGIQSTIKSIFGDGGLLGVGNFSDNMAKFSEEAFSKLKEIAANEISQILIQERDLRNEINSAIGISGELSRKLRNEIIETLPQMISMGYGFEDIKSTITSMIVETGKFTLFNKEVMGDMAVTSRAFVGDLDKLGKMFSNYEKAGYGAAGALDRINEAGKSSISLGLNARRVVSEIDTRIEKLNSYGFKNGFDGLTRMVQKSIEFRTNIEKVFTLAENLFDPDKAVALSANLQAIGGAIGDFNDPLKLMYMATNDAGGLQDAMIGVAGSLATYNSELGKFEITGVNLRKARALAGELDMSMEELSTTAIKAAERTSASADLLAGGFNLDEKQQEFITNLARMEGGKMVIDVPKGLFEEFGTETRVALDELNADQIKVLTDNQEVFEKMSTKDIALSQYTETQKLGLQVSEIVTMMKVGIARTAREPLESVDEGIKNLTNFLNNFKSNNDVVKVGEEMDKDTIPNNLYKMFGINTPTKVNDVILRPNEPPIIPNVNDTIYAVDETKNIGNNVTTENKTMKIEIQSNVNADAIRNDIMNQMAMTSDYREYIGTFS